MKKLFILILIACFALSAGEVFAVTSNYGSDNVTIMGPNMGERGVTPPVVIVKVRYGNQDVDGFKLTSGDVVCWNTTSADGVTISPCEVDGGANFAGVLVTDVLTPGRNSSPTQIDGNDRNWGYMARTGYVLVKVDSTGATAGTQLRLNGATLRGSLASQVAGAGPISGDIGVLLKAPEATDGLAPAWLR